MIYYDENFISIANMATICAIIIVVVSKNWMLHQMDVKNLFLHGDLQEEVHME